MRIIISDTSALIDLRKAVLLEALLRLPYEVQVPDLLYEDELLSIPTIEKRALRRQGLRVIGLSGAMIDRAVALGRENPALRLYDCSAWALAASRPSKINGLSARVPVLFCSTVQVGLDARADGVGDEALDGGGDPRIVARVPAGAPRDGRRASEDRGVQRLDALRAFPTPAAAGRVKCAAAGKPEERGKARPHARKDRAGASAALFGTIEGDTQPLTPSRQSATNTAGLRDVRDR